MLRQKKCGSKQRLLPKQMIHQRETFIREVASKSLTIDDCQFFLKRCRSDKVFKKYIEKYYPQNGACSDQVNRNSSYLPSLIKDKEREIRNFSPKAIENLKETHKKVPHSRAQNHSQAWGFSREKSNLSCGALAAKPRKEKYRIKLQQIIKRTKTEFHAGKVV